MNPSPNLSEIAAGDRFAFGENWSRFLLVLDENRIRQAEQSLSEMLETHTLAGRRFLDVGSGSGLFSLAARRRSARALTEKSSFASASAMEFDEERF